MVDIMEDMQATSPKLTSWKKEPSLLDLKADLKMAEPSHDAHVENVKRWLDLRNIEGEYKPRKQRGRSSVQNKLIRRQNEWRYSALTEPFLGTNKVYKIQPRTWEDAPKAHQNSLVINWQFETKINRVSFVDEVVRTFVDEGTCVVRVGWDRVTTKEMVDVPNWVFYPIESEEEMMAFQQAAQTKLENYNAFLDLPESIQESVNYFEETGEPVMAVEEGMTQVEEEKIVRNQPTVEVVDFENVYLDPNAQGDVDKANFAIVSFEISKAELKKDGRYENLDKVSWSTNGPITNQEHHSSSSIDTPEFKDEARKIVVAYEYWGWYDIDDNDVLVPIVATWVGDTIIRMEKNPFPDKGIPLVWIPYLPVKKSVTGEPDAELLEENQAILGALSRGMVDLLGKSANGQTGFAKGYLDAVNRRRYNQGLDYEFNPTAAPNAAIHEHTYPQIPNSALTMLQLQNQEAEALTGVKAFAGGLSGDAYGEVAAGVRGMLDAASKREMAILRRLAEGFRKIGVKIMMMNQQFLSEEETVRVTNEEFVQIRREDLGGEFDLIVDISTAEVDEAKSRDLVFLLQTMGNNMDFTMTKIILEELAKLKRMPELAKKISAFEPQPSPLEQAEIQLKQVEIAIKQKELEEMESQIELNRAKARKEMAQAEQADLDFVEQETGTKHLRDVDRIKAQGESNQRAKITEGILKQGENGPNPNNVNEAIGYDMLTNSLTE